MRMLIGTACLCIIAATVYFFTGEYHDHQAAVRHTKAVEADRLTRTIAKYCDTFPHLAICTLDTTDRATTARADAPERPTDMGDVY